MKKLIFILSFISLIGFTGCQDSDTIEQFEEQVNHRERIVNLEPGDKFVDIKFSGRSGREMVITRKRYDNESPETYKVKDISPYYEGETIVIVEN